MPTRELVAQQLGSGTIRYRGTAFARFLTPVAERLAESGHWTIAKYRGSYALCLPLNGALPRVKVEVPAVDELLALGDSLHKRGEPYESVAWDWPIRYTPAVFGTIVARSRRGMTLPARLEAGIPGLWRTLIEWHGEPEPEPVLWIERGCQPKEA